MPVGSSIRKEIMDVQEMIELLRHLREEHSPLRVSENSGRTVKYVDYSIDMRIGTVFSVTIRGFGWRETFHIVNECRDLPQTLSERIHAFLDEPAGSPRRTQ